MAFKQKTEDQNWKAFREKCLDHLLRTGLPDSYYSNEKLWLDFLEHGYIDHHKDNFHFTINDMSDKEYDLYLFCVREYMSFQKEYFKPAVRNLNDLDCTVPNKA